MLTAIVGWFLLKAFLPFYSGFSCSSSYQTVSTNLEVSPQLNRADSYKVPDTAKFLSDQERAYIQGRLPRNSPKNAEKDFNWQEFKDTLKDYRIWLFLGVWGFYTVGTTGLTFYQPTVFASLGFS